MAAETRGDDVINARLNPHNVVRAIAKRNQQNTVVYCERQRDGAWAVQHPERIDLEILDQKMFERRYCLESECPPQIKKLFEEIPSYVQWQMTGSGRKK